MHHYLENTQSRNAYWFAAWHPNGGRYWVGRGKLGATPAVNVYMCPAGQEEFAASKKARAKLAGDYRRGTPTRAMEDHIATVIGAPPLATGARTRAVAATSSTGGAPAVIGTVSDVRLAPDYQPPARVVTVPKEPSRWDV